MSIFVLQKKIMEERHLELSEKIFTLGMSLTKESVETEDSNTAILGKVMILLSGIISHDEDLAEFDLLCSMFSAKKLIEEIPNEVILNIISKMKNDDDDLNDDIDDLLSDLM